MIEYIRGKVTALSPAAVTLETSGGVAYRLCITLATFSEVEGRDECVLYVHENIREDAWTLFGFSSERERELFRLLIGVSGEGAATAVIILSALQGDELAAVIASGDSKSLKSIKGIGAKTAERIIVDLHDKIKSEDSTLLITPAADNAAYNEALGALQMLGFNRKQSEKVLDSIFKDDPAIKVESAIKKALSML